MENDTVRLLRECNAGIKMGITSLDEVMEHVQDRDLKHMLEKSRQTHVKLGDETHAFLNECRDEGKEPAAMAKMMSWMKTNMKLGGEESDRAVADLITDGCNMGVKSLYRYLHQYPAAGDRAKALTEKIIREEENMVKSLREYL